MICCGREIPGGWSKRDEYSGFVAHAPGVQVYIVADLDHGLVPRQEVGIAETVLIAEEYILGAEVAVEVVLKDQEAGQQVDEDTIIPVLQEVGVAAMVEGAAGALHHTKPTTGTEVEVLNDIEAEVDPRRGEAVDLYRHIVTTHGAAETQTYDRVTTMSTKLKRKTRQEGPPLEIHLQRRIAFQ